MLVVIAGATGFIGTHLRDRFTQDGHEVVSIGRHRADEAHWNDTDSIAELVDGADAVINLAGRSVDCRYDKAHADKIFTSRTETTAELGRAITRCGERGGTPPTVWLNASTGTIYRDAVDRPQDEETGEIGTGFSVNVALAWERAVVDARLPSTRKVLLRMGIVLGPDGGAAGPLVRLARLGLGGPMGPGRQKFSWIHVEDVYRALRHLIATPTLEGPVNLVTPEQVTNAELMAQLRTAVGRSYGLPTPRWLLEAGARLVRTETELVLKSRWVEPRALVGSGFTYAYPTLAEALEQAV